jgi:gamma-glutamyltranspeptidase
VQRQEPDGRGHVPGKRPLHTLNAYVISGTDGTPLAAGNCPGGDLQTQGNVQAVMGLIDGGNAVQTAAGRPRLAVWPATYPNDIGGPPKLEVENRGNDAALKELAGMGHNVSDIGPWGSFSCVQLGARPRERSDGHRPRSADGKPIAGTLGRLPERMSLVIPGDAEGSRAPEKTNGIPRRRSG